MNMVTFSEQAQQQTLTMSTRLIAELTGKRHPDVKRDCEVMFAELKLDVSKFAHIYFDSMNRQQIEYLLPKDLVETLITGYNIKLRYQVIQRLHELENQLQPKPLLPQDLPSALRALADQHEKTQLIEAERDHAIATKAEIGERREATAMATASKFKRENESLKQKLGESTNFAAVATINSKLKTNFGNKEGRQLSKYSREHGLEIKKATVQDQRFSEVNSYHRDAWLALFNINLNSVFGV